MFILSSADFVFFHVTWFPSFHLAVLILVLKKTLTSMAVPTQGTPAYSESGPTEHGPELLVDLRRCVLRRRYGCPMLL